MYYYYQCNLISIHIWGKARIHWRKHCLWTCLVLEILFQPWIKFKKGFLWTFWPILVLFCFLQWRLYLIFLHIIKSFLLTLQMIRAVPLGVGQIFACATLGPSFLIFGAVVLYSPLLAAHAMLGSAIGLLAGESIVTFDLWFNLWGLCVPCRVFCVNCSKLENWLVSSDLGDFIECYLSLTLVTIAVEPRETNIIHSRTDLVTRIIFLHEK